MSNPLHAYATDNADVNLTSAVTIFSESNAGSVPRWVMLDITVGDGTKNLAAAADTVLTFQVSNGGVLGDVITRTIPTSQTRARLQTDPICWINGETLALTCLSDQAGDTDVDVTVVARDVAPLQPATSGRTAAIDASGVIDGQVKGIDADTITAASIATDAINGEKFAASAVLKIWSQLTSGLTGIAGSFGKLLIDTLDEAVSTRSSHSAADVWSAGTRRLTDSTLSNGGTIATAADISGITQAQRVRLILPSQIERPDSSSTTYRLYIYAYDANHVAEDLDSNPTVTVENAAGTDRSSNLGVVTKPTGTGIYYVDYTLSAGDAIEQLIFQVTATEGAVATEYATTTQVVDTTAVDFTATDRANLALILEDTGTTLPATLATTAQLNARTLLAAEYATLSNQTTIISNIAALPAAVWAIATSTLTTAGTIGKLVIDQFTAVLAAISGIAGDTGSGANSITPTVTDGTDPLESAKVRFSKGAESILQTTNASGTFATPFALDNGTWTVTITLPGYTFAQTTLVVTGDATPTYAMTATGLSAPTSPRIRARLLVLDALTKDGKASVEVTVVETGAATADGYGSQKKQRKLTSNAQGLVEWLALPGEQYAITGPSGIKHEVTIADSATDPHDVTSILI